MTAEFEHPPILAVPVAAAMVWNQHTPGGCRCLCQIYHRGVGSGGCTRAAEPGLLIRLEVTGPDTTPPQLAVEVDRPLPVCGRCYRLLAVPNTPAAVLREGLDATIARHGTRFEAAAVALLADTGLLDHRGIRAQLNTDTLYDDGTPVPLVSLHWRALAHSFDDLTLDLDQEHLLELALGLVLNEPVHLTEILREIDPHYASTVAEAVSIALGLTEPSTPADTTTPPTPGEPSS
ncbi:DUF6372 family protein [Nocardia sp. NPDC058518]|uniref:DUF6372 family protein n=1 Tax=Nocardia sp. NPDC058518 TaxID=3346534 RepID=UPI00364DA446